MCRSRNLNLFSGRSNSLIYSIFKCTVYSPWRGTINTSDIIVVRDTNESDEVDVLPDNIDFNIINICAKIRKLALLDRLKFNETEHGANNGLNTYMLNYIKYCGLTPLEFIKSYLCNLQPYMIYRLKREEYYDKVICVLDNIYRILVYIKIDATQHHEVVVSFHENSKNGILTNIVFYTLIIQKIYYLYKNSRKVKDVLRK